MEPIMSSSTRPREQITSPQVASQSAPPSLTSVDFEIAKRNGTTVAIEATREHMQASKTAVTPSLTEIIYEAKQENGRLRHEHAYQCRKARQCEIFEEEMRYVFERFRMAFINYMQGMKDIEAEHSEFWKQ
jgi:hypothetical protein